MPLTCYSYPHSCFSFPDPDDVPSATGQRDATRAAPPGLRQMPNPCFKY
jgi:hypothetical protein